MRMRTPRPAGSVRSRLFARPAGYVVLALLPLLAAAGCGDDDTDVTSGSSTTASGVTSTSTAPPSTGGGPDVLEGELDESWGCGYGFRASDAAQTVAVVVEWDGGFGAADVPATAEELTLPAARWKADVWVGERLFANWCNDVVDMNQPQPDLEETWPIVEGTLSHDAPASADCGAAEVAGRLTGGVAERPDGTRVAIPDVDLVNETWGCFAG
jgi:hypothetical protein